MRSARALLLSLVVVGAFPTERARGFDDAFEPPSVEDVQRRWARLPRDIRPFWERHVRTEVPEFRERLRAELETRVYGRAVPEGTLRAVLDDAERETLAAVTDAALRELPQATLAPSEDLRFLEIRSIESDAWKIDVGKVRDYYRKHFAFEVTNVAIVVVDRIPVQMRIASFADAVYMVPTDDAATAEYPFRRVFRTAEKKDVEIAFRTPVTFGGLVAAQKEAARLVFGTPHVLYLSQRSLSANPEPVMLGILAHELGHHYVAVRYPERYTAAVLQRGNEAAWNEVRSRAMGEKAAAAFTRLLRSPELEKHVDAWCEELRRRGVPEREVASVREEIPELMLNHLARQASEQMLLYAMPREREAYHFQMHFFETVYRFDREAALRATANVGEPTEERLRAAMAGRPLMEMPLSGFVVLPSQRAVLEPLYGTTPGR